MAPPISWEMIRKSRSYMFFPWKSMLKRWFFCRFPFSSWVASKWQHIKPWNVLARVIMWHMTLTSMMFSCLPRAIQFFCVGGHLGFFGIPSFFFNEVFFCWGIHHHCGKKQHQDTRKKGHLSLNSHLRVAFAANFSKNSWRHVKAHPREILNNAKEGETSTR